LRFFEGAGVGHGSGEKRERVIGCGGVDNEQWGVVLAKDIFENEQTGLVPFNNLRVRVRDGRAQVRCTLYVISSTHIEKVAGATQMGKQRPDEKKVHSGRA
jgi:hypothetical protein